MDVLLSAAQREFAAAVGARQGRDGSGDAQRGIPRCLWAAAWFHPARSSATILLPDHAKLQVSSRITRHRILRFFLEIARLGSVQIGAGLNS